MMLSEFSLQLFADLAEGPDDGRTRQAQIENLTMFGQNLSQTLRNLSIYDYSENYVRKIYAPLMGILEDTHTPHLRAYADDAKDIYIDILTRADWHQWSGGSLPDFMAPDVTRTLSDLEISLVIKARAELGKSQTALRNLIPDYTNVTPLRQVTNEGNIIREVYFTPLHVLTRRNGP